MNGQEIFSYSLEAVPKITLEVLEKNNTTIDDIDYAIFHQTTKYIINHWRRKLKIPEEKFYMNILHTGNIVSSSIPLAIKDALDKKMIKKGDKILTAAIGVGHSLGALVFNI
jgi:3-oxoacyl-[acyl-carrier-protein] synthase-3